MGWGRREGWGVGRGRNLLAQMELHHLFGLVAISSVTPGKPREGMQQRTPLGDPLWLEISLNERTRKNQCKLAKERAMVCSQGCKLQGQTTTTMGTQWPCRILLLCSRNVFFSAFSFIFHTYLYSSGREVGLCSLGHCEVWLVLLQAGRAPAVADGEVGRRKEEMNIRCQILEERQLDSFRHAKYYGAPSFPIYSPPSSPSYLSSWDRKKKQKLSSNIHIFQMLRFLPKIVL